MKIFLTLVIIGIFISSFYYLLKNKEKILINLKTKKIILEDVYGTIDFNSSNEYIIEDYTNIDNGTFGVAIGANMADKAANEKDLDKFLSLVFKYLPPIQLDLIKSIFNKQVLMAGTVNFYMSTVSARRYKSGDQKISHFDYVGRCEVKY